VTESGDARSLDQQQQPIGRVRYRDLAAYFSRLGLLGFGGPVALVGQMERELVQDKHWLSKEQMREAIAICQSLPGPLAIQVGIFISYLRGGFWGAWLGGWLFILPNFLIVAGLAALYVHLGGLSLITGVFYGVSPAVIALILHSCWRLAKLGMEDRVQWAIAIMSFLVTVVLQAEVALLFVAAGLIGIARYGSLLRRPPPSLLATAGLGTGAQLPATGSTLVKLLLFFLKAGSLTFGSGLVIVPFLQEGLVHEYGWLNEREFLIAVAVGMISPGPVVITATFVGYLVAGFWGSLAATIGIFLPSFILVLVAAPILARHRWQFECPRFRQRRLRRSNRHDPRSLRSAWQDCHRRLVDGTGGPCIACGAVPLEGQQPFVDRGDGHHRADWICSAAADLGHG
jgi:chromate transporter